MDEESTNFVGTEHMIASANKLLSIIIWVLLPFEALLLIYLIFSILIAIKHGEWEPFIGVLVAFSVVSALRSVFRKVRKSPTLTAKQKLCGTGGIVSGLYCFGFGAMAIGWSLNMYDQLVDYLVLIAMSAGAILYLIAMVLYTKGHIRKAFRVLSVTGILNFPAGLIPFFLGFVITRVAKSAPCARIDGLQEKGEKGAPLGDAGGIEPVREKTMPSEHELRELTARFLLIKPELLTEDANFRDTLGIPPGELYDLLDDLECRLETELPQNEIYTFGDLRDSICSKQG
jgi:hypothetical protein